MQITAEVCIENWSGALAAHGAGAHRIELCQGLELGGLTPSAGQLEQTLEVGIPVVALIRSRPGDFCYSRSEAKAMAADIRHCVRSGVHGVAIGALTPAGEIDHETVASWIEAAAGVEVCFHRAFDGLREPDEALHWLAESGVHRVLTSGMATDVVGGLPNLKRWIQSAPPGLEIMPGGGVRAENISQIIAESGAGSVHFSARLESPGPMQFHNPEIAMHAVHNQTRANTSESEIRRYLSAMTRAT